GRRQLLRGDRGHGALRERGQGAEVQRKPGDGGLGNPSATGRRSVSSASCHGAPAGRAGLQAVMRPRTAPSTAGYVFVNACTKMVSDLPGQRDPSHAGLPPRRGTGAARTPFLFFWGQNSTLSSVNPAPETKPPSILSDDPATLYWPVSRRRSAGDRGGQSVRALRRRSSFTRQKVCWRPSTRTTGICSQYSACSSGSWVMSFCSQRTPRSPQTFSITTCASSQR